MLALKQGDVDAVWKDAAAFGPLEVFVIFTVLALLLGVLLTIHTMKGGP